MTLDEDDVDHVGRAGLHDRDASIGGESPPRLEADLLAGTVERATAGERDQIERAVDALEPVDRARSFDSSTVCQKRSPPEPLSPRVSYVPPPPSSNVKPSTIR